MEWTVTSVYIGCALIGGAVLLIQMLLLVLGGDVDGDFDGDAELGDAHDGSFSVFSVRAVTGFLTFFGLVGWWGSSAGWGTTPTLLAALGAGTAMMLAVAWLFALQRRLHSQGNVDFKRVVGLPAKVYLRIPADKSGTGKITVAIQGRSMEFLALSEADEIPTGADVRVTEMTTEGTYVVVPLQQGG